MESGRIRIVAIAEELGVSIDGIECYSWNDKENI